MSRLSDNDRNLGPFTLARWSKTFSFYISGGDDEDRTTNLLIAAFGWALRVRLPFTIKPFGKYGEHCRRYGFSISDMGNGYDFVQVYYGPQTHDTSTERHWCKHLPWKQWRCVRFSCYTPTGEHFASEEKGKGKFFEFMRIKETCPTSRFEFDDYDGERITATCLIDEREWHRGEGWFKWLGFFWPAKIRRSLDLQFSAEVGPEKGSWKGGTIGHGIDMMEGETPRQAFERYCSKGYDARKRGKVYPLKFVGEIESLEAGMNLTTSDLDSRISKAKEETK
jgi:hypothetical protein